jgi:hypothetical protein
MSFRVLVSPIGLLISALILINANFSPPIGIYDEGFALTNALRLLNGDVPHRDYWSVYPPGSSAVLAFAFKLWKSDLTVARLVHTVFTLAILASVYTIIARFKSTLLTCVSLTLVTIWFSRVISISPNYALITALATSTISISMFHQSIVKNNAFITICSIFVSSILVMIRHDFALYQLFAIFLCLIIEVVFCKNRVDSNNTSIYFTKLICLVTSVAALSSILICTLAFSVGIDNFLDQMITFPASVQREYRRLPVPDFFALFSVAKSKWLMAWFPVIAVPTGLVTWWMSNGPGKPQDRFIVHSTAFMSLFMLLQSHNRFDISHALPTMFYCAVFLVSLVGVFVDMRRCLIYIPVILLMAMTITSILSVGYVGVLRPMVSCVWPLSHGCMKPIADQLAAVTYVESRTRKNQYVFVGNTRHDICFVNDASIYFLLNRPCPTKWNDLHPGVITEANVQLKIISDLVRKDVQYVILRETSFWPEPNRSSISSGVVKLDTFIAKNYHKVYTKGKYAVLLKNKEFGS